jgi:AraC-like DNA-binding protein
MDVAAKLLASNPDLSVADVADRLGYKDQSLFARHFRSVAGASPREYRRGNPV